MTYNFRRFRCFSCPVLLGAIFFLVGVLAGPLKADEVILHLKSGDLISGQVISESTNQVVISNAWVKALSVPISEISKREAVEPAKPVTPPTSVVVATNKPATAASSVATTNATTSPAPVAATTNTPALPAAVAVNTNAAPKVVAAARPSVPKPAAPKGKWHGQINVGLDTLFSTTTQQDYFGNVRLTYEQAYQSNPKKFFRNTTQVVGDYQKTDGQVSANRFNGSNKSDFDIGETSYGYVSGGGGFDEVQKIGSQYQVGFGAGRHMVRTDGYVLDFEGGLDYQGENRTDDTTSQSVYGRLAEDMTWKVRKNLTFTQKLEFYQDLERASLYHGDFNANLSYGFWQNLTLNLMADERYNTDVAPGVDRNTFEARLTLGVTF